MKTRLVTIEVANFDKAYLSIETLQKVIDKKSLSAVDEMRLLDVISILRGIERSTEVAA